MIGTLILTSVWSIYQCFAQDAFATGILGLDVMPAYFGGIILGLLIANAIISITANEWLASYYFKDRRFV